MQRQSDNAFKLALKLEGHNSILSVIYPGLKSHPQHSLAIKQQFDPNGNPIFGSVFSIVLESLEKRDAFLKKLNYLL